MLCEGKKRPIDMDTPLVSIITPCYNSEKYIRETIESVQKQSYGNWEHIIVDDGSSDGTSKIVEEIASTENRIRFIQLAVNSGGAIARNAGIDMASGDYMTFIDSDDLWFQDFIESSINEIRASGIPFVYSSYRRSNEKLEFVYSDFIVPERVTYHNILQTNSISCLTAFINIKKLGKKKMPLVRKRQDMGLWLKYLKEIEYAKGILEPKAIYRIRQNSLSRDKKGLLKSQWYFYRNVENLSTMKSIYYMSWWMYLGYKKYKN